MCDSLSNQHRLVLKSYPRSEAIDECLDVDFGECVSKSESDRYRKDSRLGKDEITSVLLRFTDPEEDGAKPSGVRPGETPSYLKDFAKTFY